MPDEAKAETADLSNKGFYDPEVPVVRPTFQFRGRSNLERFKKQFGIAQLIQKFSSEMEAGGKPSDTQLIELGQAAQEYDVYVVSPQWLADLVSNASIHKLQPK